LHGEVSLPTELLKAEEYDWSLVEKPITKKQLGEWLTALRSGKFTQSTGQLGNKALGFCCLGLLAHKCELVFDGDNGLLSQLGPRDPFGNMMYRKIPSDMQSTLASLNDEAQFTFKQIADEVEESFKDYWK
jgi:hypothetical protein